MGNFVSRIHNKQNNKLYSILPLGDMPTVVFGRVIRPNSVPGTMYYFPDGVVKRKRLNGEDVTVNGYKDIGNGYIPCSNCEGKPKFERCVIFTIPENFNFSDMDNNDFISEHTRNAKQLNANTTSPNYVIRNGEIICVKMLNIKDNILYQRYEANTIIYGKNLKFLVVYRKVVGKSGEKKICKAFSFCKW